MRLASDIDLESQIVDDARRFATDRLAPGALLRDEHEELPMSLLLEAGVHDWGGMLVPPELGGAGYTKRQAALALEALSYGDPAIASFVSVHNMAAWIISAFANVDLGRVVSKLSTFETIASLCLTEQAAGSDAAAIETTARSTHDGYEISGTKEFVTGGGFAAIYVVAARSGGTGPHGISLYVIPGHTRGVSFGPRQRKMGWRAQPTSRVSFDGVRVGHDALLGEEGRGFPIVMQALNSGRLNIAACSVGAAQAALDRAVTYMGERRTLGRPLAEMQGLQFKIADMKMRLESARALVYVAATELDNGSDDAAAFCAMAKCVASEAALFVADEALQIHGGYGYLRDTGLEKLVRDLRAHPIVEGTNEIMRVIVARHLLAGALGRAAVSGRPRD